MSQPFRRAPGPVDDLLGAILREAEAQPHRRSEILGQGALNLAARAEHPRHRHEAPLLRAAADRLADAAVAATPPTMDDFGELILERNEGHAEFPEDVDAIARARDLHAAHLGEHTPRVSIQPGTFRKGTALGRVVEVKWNPSKAEISAGIQQVQTAAYWQGEPHEAQAFTVDVAQVKPLILTAVSIDGALVVSARPYAEVTYGSDGSHTTVKFDVGRGVRFTGVGSYVAVKVGMDQVSGATAEMTIGASLGSFAAPSQAPVFLTEYTDTLAADETSDFIRVPAHGVQLYPPQTNGTGGTFTVKFYNYGGGGAEVYSVDYPTNSPTINPVPITGDIGFVKVVNTTGGIAKFRLPFQLSL